MKILCCIFDSKAKVFGIPACFDSFEDARRGFFDICSDKATIIGRHPEDFILYALADYDTSTGTLKVCDRAPICDGAEYLMSDCASICDRIPATAGGLTDGE